MNRRNDEDYNFYENDQNGQNNQNQNDPFGQNNSYNPNDPFGQNNSYNPNDPFGQSYNPGSDPFGQNNGQNGYGQNYNQNNGQGYNPNGYGQNYNPNGGSNPNYAYTVLMKPKTRVWSVLSVVLAALSILCCCFDFAGIIFGVVAIVFAVISRKVLGYFDTTSIVAIIIAIFGIVLSVALLIVGAVIASNPEYLEMMEIYEEMFGEDLNGDGYINGIPVDEYFPEVNDPNEF